MLSRTEMLCSSASRYNLPSYDIIARRGYMKKIFLITTGGTIASRQTSDGLAPSVTSDEILEYIPEVDEICSITT